ncbi:MAG: preprotein translocase subunit YajC [Spirochaetes bacterium]|nr:preprotein translocase subunit YajC [Spirochaetota bacterium]
MNTLFTSLPVIQAQAEASGQLMTTLITFGAVFLIMYLLIIRPQNKQKKELQKMIETLQKNDKVITIGGVHGTVVSTRDNTVVIKVDEGCKIEFSKSAVATVVSREGSEKPVEKIEEKKGDKNEEPKAGENGK